MKVGLTVPNSGAGRWAWTGWLNAFNAIGHEAFIINGSIANRNDIDLVICSTSNPSEDIIKWRNSNKHKKLALNVLAWTNEDLPCINNPGVQASEGNVLYAQELKPDIVFAQYFEKWREILLSNWRDREGYKLGSMGMAADSTVYDYSKELLINIKQYPIFYVGGYWPYKARNIDKYLLPVFQKYFDKSMIIGKGWPWPFRTNEITNEREVGYHFRNALVCPNVHEPHSTLGGYDIVERVFKVMYCGGLLISDYVKEMEDIGIKNGVHCLMAKNPEEYMALVDQALTDPTKYNTIRENGRMFVGVQHTYIHRVNSLLKELE